MAGRPRKAQALSTGKISKEEKAERQELESMLKLSRDGLKPPAFLSEVATAEFMRVVEEAAEVNLLDNLDLTVLAIYANAWGVYAETAEHMAKHGYTDTHVTQSGEKTIVSAQFQVQERSIKTIMQCSTKLGLATTDRLKLVVPRAEKEEENKFLKYIK